MREWQMDLGNRLWEDGHYTAAAWVWWEENPARVWWHRTMVPGPNDVARSLARPFLCPCCDGRGGWTEYEGPDEPCGACDEVGMMTWGQRIGWWVWCKERHRRPLSWLVGAYCSVMIRWWEWRAPPRCDACNWPLAECKCGEVPYA